MYLVTYVSAETCNVQPEAPKVQKPNIQVYKSNVEYVHPMISTPPKSPPSKKKYGATRRSGSLNFINLIFLLQGTLCHASYPAQVIPSTCHLSLPETQEPGFRVKISPSLGGTSENLAPEEGDGWPHGSIHVGIRDVHLEVSMMWPRVLG